MSAISDKYRCPITHEVMTDPVLAPDTHNYEREAITLYLHKSPISPMTRQPMRVDQLIENRELRQEIQGMLASSETVTAKDKAEDVLASTETNTIEDKVQDMLASAETKTAKDKVQDMSASAETMTVEDKVQDMLASAETKTDEDKVQDMLASGETMTVEDEDQIFQNEPAVCTGEIRSDGSLTQVSVSVSDGEAPPLSIAFVKDTSGSMNREVTTAVGESDGYNMLDIACHGTNVCINSLRPCDRAMIISFSSKASVVAPLNKVTPGHKAAMKSALAGLYPNGSTNLWDGIKTALKMLPKDGIVCVLTDGEPNVRPRKGELHMFNKWRHAHPNWRGQVHTFGFGYCLDSELLVNIARAGNGRYSFIPDSSLVGTVFIHSMANILTTHAAECLLSVKTNGKVTGIGPHTKTSRGYQIPIGPLMRGQRRDYFLSCSSAETCMCCSSAVTCTIKGIELSPSGTPNASDERQRTALAIYDSLKSSPNLEKFAATISDPKLLEDINGQWKEAMQSKYFERWGRHYLPSLAAAHLTQTCNNFLDKGIQTYGGARFHQLRDAFDKIFNEMPAPKASLRQQVEERARSEGWVMRSALTNMASYNVRGAPCFPGWCTVKNDRGVKHALASLQKGDKVLAPGGMATVLCILKTMCPQGSAKLVRIGKLYATPWHPIKSSKKWIFPSSVGNAEDTPCEAVYSLLLDKPSCFIEGVECIGLGHGIEDDEVASHAFFGTEKVIQTLDYMDYNNTGLVVLPGPEAVWRDSSGLVCGFVV